MKTVVMYRCPSVEAARALFADARHYDQSKVGWLPNDHELGANVVEISYNVGASMIRQERLDVLGISVI
jgi:hypothetical protein